MIVKPLSLYTPVQIAKGRLDEPANVRPYSIQKYRENPFQEAKTSVESLTDQKKKIVHWLRSMSVPERKEKFAFQCPEFVALLRAMFERRVRFGDRSFRITEEPQTRLLVVYGKENTYRIDSAAFDEAEEELTRNVVLLSYKSQFDSVSLSERILANLEKLFDVFEVLEDGVSNELSVEEYRSLERQGNEAFFYRKDETDHYKKSMGKWLIEVLKKKLWCEYYRNLEESAENKHTKEKKRFNKVWKEVPPNERRECLRICSYATVCQAIERYTLSQRVRWDILPRIEVPPQGEIDEFMNNLAVQSDLDVYDFLTQCTLMQACHPISLVRFPLFEHLREYRKKVGPTPNNVQKKQTFQPQKKKKNKPKKKRTSITENSSGLELTTQQSTSECPDLKHCQASTPTKTGNPRERKESTTEVKLPRSQETLPEPKFVKKQREKQQKPQPQTLSLLNQQSKDSSATNNSSSIFGTPLKSKKSARRQYVQLEEPPNMKFKGKAKSTASNETNESISYRQEEPEPIEEALLHRQLAIDQLCQEKERSDLVEVADSISQCANSYGPYRIVAFNRIQYLLSSWGVSIKIFGSCATGLALANSDIDLAVDPSILNYFYAVFGNNKEKVCMALCSILKMIEGRSWVTNVKLITTATVPILKFVSEGITQEINPNIPFEESPKDSYLNTKDKEKQRKVSIKVDLTIESFYSAEDSTSINHLGIMATNNMKDWMTAYPSLHTVSIVLKDLLKRRDLNNIYKGTNWTYAGGISSYALIIVVIAFMHAKRLTDQKNPAVVFYGFIKFLLEEFQHQKYGVDITANNPSFPFFELQTPLPGKIQVRDPLNGKIVTSNSYQYDKILEELGSVAAHRKRIREDLERTELKLSPQGKYFSRNYLQELFTD